MVKTNNQSIKHVTVNHLEFNGNSTKISILLMGIMVLAI